MIDLFLPAITAEFYRTAILKPTRSRDRTLPTAATMAAPMGGNLVIAPPGKAPRFVIRSLRNPDNANLDRVQIIPC